MLALHVQSLEKSYRSAFSRVRHHALRGVELSVPRGTAFGLIGPNGAGKTTFIKALLGVVRPTAGTISVLGGSPDDPEVRRRIGYLPERLHLPSALTPLAYLDSVARLKGTSREPTVLRKLLSRVGLGNDGERLVGEFSKGMKQRLALAIALLGEPELLVLDEPTDGVDPIGRAEIRTLLAEERARGATLFLNSHLLSETERICDRIGILSEGRLVREGPLEDLCGNADAYRIRLAPGYDENALKALGFGSGPEPHTFLIHALDPAELNRLVDGARATGALLLELRRDARQLEEVLTEALGAYAK